MTKPGDLMTLGEVAALFPGRTVRWVRERLVTGRRVDSVRIDGVVFVLRPSLERFLVASTTRAWESAAPAPTTFRERNAVKRDRSKPLLPLPLPLAK